MDQKKFLDELKRRGYHWLNLEVSSSGFTKVRLCSTATSAHLIVEATSFEAVLNELKEPDRKEA